MNHSIHFIDLFAGIGGMRLGFEKACQKFKIKSHCVFTSEIKNTAIQTYQENFKNSNIEGDITQISSQNIPDFDILLAGFPCQPFSSAGNRQGFLDTRGTLFFEIERILADKYPFGFILENVEGLVKHDKGRTLQTILHKLEKLNYFITWKVLNSKDFGIPQDRKRIYIVGTKNEPISLEFTPVNCPTMGDILEQSKPVLKTPFVQILLSYYTVEQLYGKAIKDKRGGINNIHSWDLELKGKISPEQKKLLNLLLKERRRKIWAEKKGIHWMDGMPLTVSEIKTFYDHPNLKKLLDDLVNKGYLRFEYPKDVAKVPNKEGKLIKKRQYRIDLPKGYNIVVGKLSFEINKILHPLEITPTLLPTDMSRLVVGDGEGLRQLTIREVLRLFGFPEDYKIPLSPEQAYDLLGNSVVVPVIEQIAERVIIQKLLSIPNQDYRFSCV